MTNPKPPRLPPEVLDAAVKRSDLRMAAKIIASKETMTKHEVIELLRAGPVCSALVADFTGYCFHRCGKPAKWNVGNFGLRCGLHARGKRFEAMRKPLNQ